MPIMAMTVALIALTLAAGYLLWLLLLHFEEIRTTAEYDVPQPRAVSLLILTFGGLLVVGTLAVLLVEVEELLATAPI